MLTRVNPKGCRIVSEDPHRERIDEDRASFQHLMRCAVRRGGKRRAAWLSILHLGPNGISIGTR
jgi:hypothetical protein